MKKYDITKIDNFVYELGRMCRDTPCWNCGLGDCCIRDDVDKIIRVVAKWAKENPENPTPAPTLTRQERAFLEAFGAEDDDYDNYYVERENTAVWIKLGSEYYRLNLPFESIRVGESLSIKTLLTWEVDDEKI